MGQILTSVIGVYFLLASFATAEVEVGSITWGRDYEAALKASKSTGKPVFLLFQEVPGCKGCQDFGREVLSNPLMKKAVEDSFIPLMVRNNASSGSDVKILELFSEPAWNYQVVRFINSEGKDIIPRKDRVWDRYTLSERMIKTLKRVKQSVPPSLTLLHLEEDLKNHEKAALSMSCFWTGEARLGRLHGVVSTEAGWFDGREVTLVTYHKKELPLQALISAAKNVKCAQAVYAPSLKGIKRDGSISYGLLNDSYRPARASDQKRQMKGSGLDLSSYTPAQLTKINAYIRFDPDAVLLYL